MKHLPLFPWILGLALATTLSLTACSNDNDEPGGSQSPQEAVSTYDDLDYFQNAIIEVNSLGEMLNRSYGEVIDDSDPTHLFIGVDNLTEAETLFREWIAPDIELSTTIPTTGGLTCPLTDPNGQPQGTIYFKPGTGTSVAEVTASSETALKHFRRITFLLNSAWPHNESIYQHYTEGDIITYSPTIIYYGTIGTPFYPLSTKDKTLKWVCIRQGSKGVKPMFCAITNSNYNCNNEETAHEIRISDYCPGEAKAMAISKTLRASWNFYVERFAEAGCGKLTSEAYWIDKTHWNWVTFYDYIYYNSGSIYGAKTDEMELPYILKIDWLDDDAITTSLAGTAGCNPVQAHESYITLFDGKTSTKWCTYRDHKKKSINGRDDVWFVDFQANAPLWATGYKMTTGNDCEKYKGRNPKAWKLYAKPNVDDEWEKIAEVNNSNMADVNCKTYSYTIDEPSYYMFFRLEISSCVNGGHMQLSELSIIAGAPKDE